MWKKGYAYVLTAVLLSLLPTQHGLARESTSDCAEAEAEALIQAGHWKRARAMIASQVKAHPQDARSCYLSAEVEMSLGDLDGALTLAQQAVSLADANSGYHLKLGQVYGEMAARASMFAAGALALKFRRQVEIALELNPKNLDALDSMMQFKFQAPTLMGGSKDEARALAERITLLNPGEGYLAQAELAEMGNDPAQQEACLLKAVQADPQSYSAHTALAKFYSQPAQAKLEEAAREARYALQLDRRQIGAHWILARVLALQRQWGDLDKALSASDADVPDDLRPFYEAARALLGTGVELSRAEGYAKKYLSQEPEGGEPDGADAHRLLGLLFEKESRKPEARAEIQTALQLRPNFKAAKDDLKRLGSS